MTIVGLISSLKACPKILFKWFDNNYIKPNSNKSHLPLSTESDVDITANVSEDITSNTSFGSYFLFMKPVQQRQFSGGLFVLLLLLLFFATDG